MLPGIDPGSKKRQRLHIASILFSCNKWSQPLMLLPLCIAMPLRGGESPGGGGGGGESLVTVIWAEFNPTSRTSRECEPKVRKLRVMQFRKVAAFSPN